MFFLEIDTEIGKQIWATNNKDDLNFLKKIVKCKEIKDPGINIKLNKKYKDTEWMMRLT